MNLQFDFNVKFSLPVQIKTFVMTFVIATGVLGCVDLVGNHAEESAVTHATESSEINDVMVRSLDTLSSRPGSSTVNSLRKQRSGDADTTNADSVETNKISKKGLKPKGKSAFKKTLREAKKNLAKADRELRKLKIHKPRESKILSDLGRQDNVLDEKLEEVEDSDIEDERRRRNASGDSLTSGKPSRTKSSRRIQRGGLTVPFPPMMPGDTVADCPSGSTPVTGTASADHLTADQPDRCLLGLEGADSLQLLTGAQRGVVLWEERTVIGLWFILPLKKRSWRVTASLTSLSLAVSRLRHLAGPMPMHCLEETTLTS